LKITALAGRVLDHLEEWLIAFLIAAATLLIFVAVTHRYALDMAAKFHLAAVYDALFKINLSWAQELCIYMFVWMAKFGAAYGVRTGIHVGVDVLVNRMPVEWRKKGILLALCCGALFTGIVGTLGLRFVWENGMHYALFHLVGLDTGELPEGPTSPDLEWPTWIIYSAVPMGSYLMCLRFVQVIVGFVRTGEVPHHDHAHVDGLSDDDQSFDNAVLQGGTR
jgi:C4-dicarboxylate transporter DctQ subunit